MTQATDIVLDAVGYMLLPGKQAYRRAQDGLPEGRVGRVVQRDFFGGQHRALQLERDKGWDSSGVGPAFFGQGVEPWPNTTTHTDAALLVTPSAGARVPHLIVGDFCYFGIGRYLFRTVARAVATWADVTQVADLGAGKIVRDLAAYRGNIVISCTTGLDAQTFTYPSGPLSAFKAGLKTDLGIGYGRMFFYLNAAGPDDQLGITDATNTATRDLDAPILRLGAFNGRLIVATRQSLFTLAGHWDTVNTVWVGDLDPLVSHGNFSADDDFIFLQQFGGNLYTWLGGQVMEYRPFGEREGWRSAGLDGLTCYGACVTAGWLIVAIQSPIGDFETWGFDGSGWWLIRRHPTDEGVWPIATGGGGDRDLLVLRDASATYDLSRLVRRSATIHTYPATGSYTTSLLDGGDRDKPKAWRKIGATFAAPEARGNDASIDAVTLGVQYSVDGGKTFTQVATVARDSPDTERLTELAGEIDSPLPIAALIQLKATWTSVSDWAPVLVCLWAEYELLDAPARRRRWQLTVKATDEAIDRDGNTLAITGRQAIANLWTDWQAGATLTFRDLDYDADPTERSVRIVGIAEEIEKPADAHRWGEGRIMLTLVEV